jgi:hypothetical protein
MTEGKNNRIINKEPIIDANNFVNVPTIFDLQQGDIRNLL